ncbi:hypothetical protein KC19_1G205400 [Ceratodon purpureus]|uniref:Protein kinase domain-containing protein n=1 Tax=Ceratodon purpureus TaxID=3225 RepID=A0A8T0J7E9_CERPU|nr:hypothetical protein KC19_1G205400 [Ceratodon purpureus]
MASQASPANRASRAVASESVKDDLLGSFEGRVGNYKVDYASIEELEINLGRGSTAYVNKAMWNGTPVALKTFNEPGNVEFEREVLTLSGLSHPNVVSLLCYAMDKRKCSIVLELMEADLCNMMQKRMDNADTDDCPPFHIAEAVDIIHQIAEGMNYLHQKRIIHRDLKSLNVLITGLKTGQVRAKVADFGLCKTKERSITNSNLTPNTGTYRWMAPEVIQTRNKDGQINTPQCIDSLKYPFKIDLYSFAMVCCEILTGEVPFKDTGSPASVKAKVLKGDRPELPPHCPGELKALIELCWDKEPNVRPSFSVVCEKLKSIKSSLTRGELIM